MRARRVRLINSVRDPPDRATVLKRHLGSDFQRKLLFLPVRMQKADVHAA
ncbi:hypothetical protein GCM10023334_089110 [Nonomuraea thailandensis]